jgi:uncharacterized membrane protein
LPAAILILALSVVGLLDSMYFLLVQIGVLRPDTRLVPRFCRMSPGTCASIVRVPDAAVLGPPNSVLGVAYYLAALGLSVARLATGKWWFLPWLAAASAVAAAISLYLAWRLIFRIRVPCPLCFAAHAANWAIAVALALQL